MIAVLQYKHTSNPRNLPGDWPAETRQHKQGDALPANWVAMSESELSTLIASLQSAYDAAIASVQTPPPDEVLLWQFRTAVTLAGLKESVDSTIAGLPEPAKTIATEKWEYGNTIRRNHPMIAQLSALLGLTSAQVDDVFKTAASLA